MVCVLYYLVVGLVNNTGKKMVNWRQPATSPVYVFVKVLAALLNSLAYHVSFGSIAFRMLPRWEKRGASLVPDIAYLRQFIELHSSAWKAVKEDVSR